MEKEIVEEKASARKRTARAIKREHDHRMQIRKGTRKYPATLKDSKVEE